MTPEEVRQERDTLDRQEHRAEMGYNETIAGIKAAHGRLQDNCLHKNVKEYHREFGRNPTYLSCVDCGAELEVNRG